MFMRVNTRAVFPLLLALEYCSCRLQSSLWENWQVIVLSHWYKVAHVNILFNATSMTMYISLIPRLYPQLGNEATWLSLLILVLFLLGFASCCCCCCWNMDIHNTEDTLQPTGKQQYETNLAVSPRRHCKINFPTWREKRRAGIPNMMDVKLKKPQTDRLWLRGWGSYLVVGIGWG